jgi:hypothetical protein
MYRKLIMELTQCSTAESARVEQFMRDKWHTLDGLSRAEFRRESRAALKIARDNPDLYA